MANFIAKALKLKLLLYKKST